MAASSTLQLTIVNNTGAKEAYFAVVGLNSNGCWAYLATDGSLVEFSATSQNNYLHTLSSTTTIELPCLSSGQIYLSVNAPFVIGTNADPEQPCGTGLVLPAGWASGDPNYHVQYDVVEFTFNGGGLNCDITQVDAFGLPITMKLVGNSTQTAGGWTKSMAEIFTAFRQQPLLAPLIVASGGTDYRILNPSHGIDTGVFPAKYFDAYIAMCWAQYTPGNPLNINITGGAYAGNYIGTVAAGTNQPMTITLTGKVMGTIGYPSTSNAFYCNGVFDQGNTAMGAISNVVATAINRGILHINPQPDCTTSNFYPPHGTYNLYAQLLHSLAEGGLCYAFAYDDQCSQSSDISDGSPTAWTITLEPLS